MSQGTKILFIVQHVPLDSGWRCAEFIDDDGCVFNISLESEKRYLNENELLSICYKALKTTIAAKIVYDNYKKILKAYEHACEIHDFTFRKYGGGCDGCDKYLYLVKDDHLYLLTCDVALSGLIRSEKVVKVLLLLEEGLFYFSSFCNVMKKKDFDFKGFYLRAFSKEIEKDDLINMEMENHEKDDVEKKRKKKRCLIC